MNKNKGIIGIGLIVAIVLGIIVVGGGAYYLGKSGNKQEVKSPENVLPNVENQNLPVNNNQQVNAPTTQTVPVATTDCVSSSKPSITVLSPNGGEIYKVGDKITVKWNSCNVSSTSYDIVVALHQDGAWDNVMYLSKATINDGSEIFAIPANIKAGSYKVRVGSSIAKIEQDFSDSSFTINSGIETTQVKVYFAKKSFSGCAVDIKASDLDYFYRSIPKTQAVARASIEELLKGPTQEEINKGYISDIPNGTILKSINITNGVALVDFNGTIENGTTSCSGGMKIWQIRQTLLQFPTITTVKFSVDGRTENIFQA